MRDFSARLIAWYLQHKRDLPWRNTSDPYYIWLSEVIMQQTRVDQGLAYYNRFVASFPTVTDLASAHTDEVLKLWQGLGYYSRARNLHGTAKFIVENHRGVFPSDFESILALKGVGDYTASAIASFAFNLPHAVVDGNVYRVLSRIFGIETPIDSTAAKKEFKALASELLSQSDPATHNQAIMEFGATCCKPLAPLCASCPFAEQCIALRKGKVAVLPRKQKKTKSRDRYFNYLVLRSNNQTVIRQRPEGDIWTGLFDFPLIETENELAADELLKSKAWKEYSGRKKYHLVEAAGPYRHVLSHQKINAYFLVLEPLEALSSVKPHDSIVISEDSIGEYAVPRLIERFLQDRG
jgi:A/G-specific adenine glycosylase